MLSGGRIFGESDVFLSNKAVGGAGGAGGQGGRGGINHSGGYGGVGGAGGAGNGGAIWLSSGTMDLSLTTLQNNNAVGGAGGLGGAGGVGGTVSVSLNFTNTVPGTNVQGGQAGLGGQGGLSNGGGLYVAGGTLTLVDSTVSGNMAVGGAGGKGGLGGGGGSVGSVSISKYTGGLGGGGGRGWSGMGGGLYINNNATVDILNGAIAGNQAVGGAGGAGGTGGSGPGYSSGTISGGQGGTGGNGSDGVGGGLYLNGGTLTILNSTVAANSAGFGTGGAAGSGGVYGPSYSHHAAKGPKGSKGTDSAGLGLDADGVLNLFNSTLALNTIQGGSGGTVGLDVVGGTVNAVSTIFAANGTTDVSGKINATDSLFQSTESTGTITGTGNLINVDPLLDPKGLQNNGGPTQTIALEANSPAFGAGQNPQNLITDQRGSIGRSGPGGVDIGSYQHTAVANTIKPVASLNAQDVSALNASSLNPYSFTISFTDSAGINTASVAGSTALVTPPSGGPAIVATLVNVQAGGSSDANGDATSITATYQFTPPGGAWSIADDGVYSVQMGGTPVSDLSGNPLANPAVGTFNVNLADIDSLKFTTGPKSTIQAGSAFSLTVEALTSTGVLDTHFNGLITIALAADPQNGILNGTLQATASGGVASFSGLSMTTAGQGDSIKASATGVLSATSSNFAIIPGPVETLVLSTLPPTQATAGESFGFAVDAYDNYNNLESLNSTSVSLAILPNPNTTTLNGTTTEATINGAAVFGGLSIDVAASNYVIQVSDGSATLDSAPITITPASPYEVVLTTPPPTSIVAGNTFNLTAEVEDQYGNATPAYAHGLSIAFGADPTGATLYGAAPGVQSGAFFTFSGLSIQTASPTGYTLSVDGVGLNSALSGSIIVSPASATHLVFTTEPPGTIQAGSGISLTVSAEDQYNNIDTSYVSSVGLAIGLNPGGATLGGTSIETPTAGVATFSGLTLNKADDGYTLVASSGTLPDATSSSISVTRAPATVLAISTDPPASIQAGQRFGFSVVAEDLYGNVDPFYAGDVSVKLVGNPSGQFLNGSTSTIMTGGQGVFVGLTLDQAGTGYTLEVSSSGLSSSDSNAIKVTPAPANHLVISAPAATSVTAGVGFGLTLQAEDGFGNLDTSYVSPVVLGLQANPGGSTLGGVNSVAAIAGVATFSNVTLDKPGSGYILLASSGLLGGTTTLPITVSPDKASKIAFIVGPPSNTVAGSIFNMTVAVEDAAGNVDVSYTGPITLALPTEPGGIAESILGTTQLATTEGQAVFSGLALTGAGSGITIDALATGLGSVASSAVAVTPGTATHLQLISQPPANLLPGQTFNVTVAAEDAYGNVDPNYASTVSLALSSNPGAATISGGSTTATPSAGFAVFSGLSLNNSGVGYVIQASGANVSSAKSSAFAVAAPQSSGGGAGGSSGSGPVQASASPVALMGETLYYKTAKHKKVLIGFELTFSGGLNPASPERFELCALANGQEGKARIEHAGGLLGLLQAVCPCGGCSLLRQAEIHDRRRPLDQP